jgi:hypothetical protein
MRQIGIITLLYIFCGYTHGQYIMGKTISQSLSNYENLPGIAVTIDSISQITDIDGQFKFESLTHYPNSIIFSGSFHPKLLIFNLPCDYDSLDLGLLEMIEYEMISPTQYDSLRNELIKTFDLDIITVQQKKADLILKSKYTAINDWNHIVGYIVLDEINKSWIINPYDKQTKLDIIYDRDLEVIKIDYTKFIH